MSSGNAGATQRLLDAAKQVLTTALRRHAAGDRVVKACVKTKLEAFIAKTEAAVARETAQSHT